MQSNEQPVLSGPLVPPSDIKSPLQGKGLPPQLHDGDPSPLLPRALRETGLDK